MADDKAEEVDASALTLDTFAGRLNYLFQTVHPRGQRPFSYDHVAESITKERGIDISANYIWMLRSGRRDNPTLRHMEGLAWFFGVSPAFLSDAEEAGRVREQLDKLSTIADSGLQHVAMRGGSVGDNTLDVIHALLDQVRQLTDGMVTGPRVPEKPDRDAKE
ncbi:MAG: transcriptional regulator [Frankiales bacterium]|nr:transcriptional regulator [Frankiales bacterium]